MPNKYKRETHAVIAVDVAVFSIIKGQLHLLLVQTNKPELKGMWALPGGLIKPEEDLEAAVRRTLKEKANLEDVFFDQLETFGSLDRDPFGRVVSVAYLALINADDHVLKTTDQYDNIKWYPLNRLPKLAYDHTLIAKKAMERLKAKIQYSNLAMGMLPKEFTLTKLQSVYEIILGAPLDKRNFRKKIIETGLVKGTGKQESGKRNRPAKLYRFARGDLRIIPIFLA